MGFFHFQSNKQIHSYFHKMKQMGCFKELSFLDILQHFNPKIKYYLMLRLFLNNIINTTLNLYFS